MIKKLLLYGGLFIATAATVSSCDKSGVYDSYVSGNSGLYSDTNKVLFSDVIFYISPYLSDGGTKRYVVAERLENLIIIINEKEWGPSNSYALNPAAISTEVFGGYNTTTNKISYPFKVNVQISSENFSTAGEFATLVKNQLNLQPGSYICRFKSFCIPEDGNTPATTVEIPSMWCTLDVLENHASASLGEFEMDITNL